MSKKVFYLAGPMSGLKQFNFPAFDRAASVLRKRGYKIVSPAELDDKKTRKQALASKDGHPGKQKHTWGDFLARDVKLVADKVQGIVLMPGWTRSRGARLEAFVALLCKHEFRSYDAITKTTRKMQPQIVLSLINTYTNEEVEGPPR